MSKKQNKSVTLSRQLVAKVLDQLNAALSEEWLGYYQYWGGSRMVRGDDSKDIAKAFRKHADEELRHAAQLADRILALGGVPVLTPHEWLRHARCVAETPTEFDGESLLRAIIVAEECAVYRYMQLCALTKDADAETYKLARHLLEDEEHHLHRLEGLSKKLRKAI